jgi:hypothetical protein
LGWIRAQQLVTKDHGRHRRLGNWLEGEIEHTESHRYLLRPPEPGEQVLRQSGIQIAQRRQPGYRLGRVVGRHGRADRPVVGCAIRLHPGVVAGGVQRQNRSHAAHIGCRRQLHWRMRLTPAQVNRVQHAVAVEKHLGMAETAHGARDRVVLRRVGKGQVGGGPGDTIAGKDRRALDQGSRLRRIPHPNRLMAWIRGDELGQQKRRFRPAGRGRQGRRDAYASTPAAGRQRHCQADESAPGRLKDGEKSRGHGYTFI